MQLSLFPNLYPMSEQALKDFYFKIADETPIDIVYLGEVICFKRRHIIDKSLDQIIQRLENAGKEILLSTIALIKTPDEIEYTKNIIKKGFSVELNDISAFSMFQELKKEEQGFVVGSFVNTYNERTLKYFENKGTIRISLPFEIRDENVEILKKHANVPLERAVYGKFPLAISSRCYTARSYGFDKNDCQLSCFKHPSGLKIKTMEGQGFLNVNGTCVMTDERCDISDIRNVDILKLIPGDYDIVKISKKFATFFER